MNAALNKINDCFEIIQRYGFFGAYKRLQLSHRRKAWDNLTPVIRPGIDAQIVQLENPLVTPRKAFLYDLIIPVYNSYEQLANLLASLERHPPLYAKSIKIADDCSTDTRIPRLIDEFAHKESRTEIISHQINRGFSQTTTHALGTCCEDICVILNSDTIVGDGALDRLVLHFEENPKLATICPLSNHAAYANLVHSDQLAELKPESVLHADYQLQSVTAGSYKVPFSSGFCWAIRRSIFNDLGGFADDFQEGYGEEADYCLRAWEAGYECRVAANVAVFHEGSSSFGKQRADFLSRMHSTLLLKKHPVYLELVNDRDLLEQGNLERRRVSDLLQNHAVKA